MRWTEAGSATPADDLIGVVDFMAQSFWVSERSLRHASAMVAEKALGSFARRLPKASGALGIPVLGQAGGRNGSLSLHLEGCEVTERTLWHPLCDRSPFPHSPFPSIFFSACPKGPSSSPGN